MPELPRTDGHPPLVDSAHQRPHISFPFSQVSFSLWFEPTRCGRSRVPWGRETKSLHTLPWRLPCNVLLELG